MNTHEDNIEDVIDQPPAPRAPGMDNQRKLILGLIAALVVVTLGMFAWKASAVSELEEKLTQVVTEQAAARSQLIDQARQLDARHSEEALRSFSVPVAWVIRRELMAANLDQVDQYFTDLVQIRGFQSALLAAPDGKVLVASDRKKLADPFVSLYPAEYLQAREIKIERAANGNLRTVIPVMGLNQQLGTAVLEYAPAAYALQ